jgi:ABC-type uncharacterized transport system substrate-binding protein
LAWFDFKLRTPRGSKYRMRGCVKTTRAKNAQTPEMFRRAGDYVDKILRGAKAADMPVEQPSKFDLIVNLKTAKALRLELSPSPLAAPTT